MIRYIFLLCALSSQIIFAQGYYLEFKLSNTKETALGGMKIYAQDNNTRTEVNFTNGQMSALIPKGMAALVLAKEPNKVYMLNTIEKTYMEIVTSNSEEWQDYPKSDYEITVVGKEKVNGYNTTHVKIKLKNSNQVQDMWTSTDIIGYTDFYKVKTQYTGKSNLYDALEAKGASGFPVRMMMNEGGQQIQMDLVKAEKRAIQESNFSLSGYRKGGLLPGFDAGSIDLSKYQNIQNMSPEEQQKAVEELMKQFQQTQPKK